MELVEDLRYCKNILPSVKFEPLMYAPSIVE